jgi:hypothetical protein
MTVSQRSDGVGAADRETFFRRRDAVSYRALKKFFTYKFFVRDSGMPL